MMMMKTRSYSKCIIEVVDDIWKCDWLIGIAAYIRQNTIVRAVYFLLFSYRNVGTANVRCRQYS